MVYLDFKNWPITAASDKVFHDKAFNIAKTPKYDGYQRGLASVYKVFDKKYSSANTLAGGILKMRICQTRNYRKQKFEKG